MLPPHEAFFSPIESGPSRLAKSDKKSDKNRSPFQFHESIVPDVSLITSWHIPIPNLGDSADKPELSPLTSALRERVNLFDLYFLSLSDISWYKGCLNPKSPARNYETPLDFVAHLTTQDLASIAEKLLQLLTAEYRGPLIGPRPRFSSLATNWPEISLPAEEDTGQWRSKAIRAVCNSLYLAAKLGCRTVEIVCGAGIPEPREDLRDVCVEPKNYRNDRYKALVGSLCQIYGYENPSFHAKMPHPLRVLINEGLSKSRLPRLALEIEPGAAFLLNNLYAYGTVLQSLNKVPEKETEAERRARERAASHVWLNLDVAHLMLAGHDASHLNKEIQLPNGQKYKFRDRAAHMHLSDHERTHNADLCPGTFHFYEHYKEWLHVAIELRRQSQSQFSGVIAIELEACNDIHEAARAVSTTKRWLATTAQEMDESLENKGERIAPADAATAMHTGCILVTDLGNSTEALMKMSKQKTRERLKIEAQGSEPDKARQQLKNLEDESPIKSPGSAASAAAATAVAEAISRLCEAVLTHGGSVLSFTGDGCIAFFDTDQFLTVGEAAGAALKCEKAMRQEINQRLKNESNNPKQNVDQPRVCLRTALHYGQAHIPTSGALMHQIIGLDVVIATRLCDWVAKNIEPAVPKNQRRTICAMTKEFHKVLKKEERQTYVAWGNAELKGVDKVSIFIEQNYCLGNQAQKSNGLAP